MPICLSVLSGTSDAKSLAGGFDCLTANVKKPNCPGAEMSRDLFTVMTVALICDGASS